MFESRNQNVDGQRDSRRTLQSNRRVAYMQPAQQNTVNAIIFKLQGIYSSQNLKVAFAQLCNKLQLCNSTT